MLPTRSFRVLWHVGALRGRRKTDSSYEGQGLSVSQHPEDWAEIASLSGPTWELRRADGRSMKLVNMTKLTKAQRRKLAGALVREEPRWRLTWTDSEDGGGRWSLFATEADARDEAEDMDDARVEQATVPVATEALRRIWSEHFTSELDDVMAEDYAILVALEASGYDGAWWNERHDPQSLSAPRGVIFQSAMPNFMAIKT